MPEMAVELAHSALDRLPSDEAAFVYHIHTDKRPSLGDRQKAEDIAHEAAGEEFAYFMGFCDARARRLVAAYFPLIAALIPGSPGEPNHGQR